MTRYLLDTSVASALAPGRMPGADIGAGVLGWFEANEPYLYLSVMTVMEIESGIEQLARSGSTRKGPQLSGWLSGLLRSFSGRILPVDQEVAIAAGRMEAQAIVNGRHPGLADVIIAATGDVHRLTILTQNLRHFAPLGVPASNPFKGTR